MITNEIIKYKIKLKKEKSHNLSFSFGHNIKGEKKNPPVLVEIQEKIEYLIDAMSMECNIKKRLGKGNF